MLKQREFNTIGKFKYFEEYNIDKKNKCIREYKAFIKSYKNILKNIIIESERIIEDDKPTYFQNRITANVLNDKRNSRIVTYYTNSSNVISIHDTLFAIEDRIKDQDHPHNFDSPTQINYNLSNKKTDTDYTVFLGFIRNNKDNLYDVNITVDKENVVENYKRSFSVKKIVKDEIGTNKTKYNTEIVPKELYNLTNDGYVHFKDQAIYHNFFDKNDNFLFSKLLGYEYPIHSLLPDVIPGFYNHHRYELYDSEKMLEAYSITFDNWGLIEKLDFSKYPVIYEDFYNEMEELEAIYSLHPLHFDYSNFNTKYTDNLYCQDSLELFDDGDENIAIYSRHVRELSEESIAYMRIDYHLSVVHSVLYNEDFDTIVAENID